jgi:acyl-CoA synthetase (AMP-forming)/AMP-acid ligase II
VAVPDCAQLFDEDGCHTQDGATGELAIRGSNLFKGYWQGPGKIDSGRRNGWFFTGDILRKDDTGEFHYVARKKDLIITDGDNVAPVEVELALLAHPAVTEAAVIGIPDPALGQRIVGFVILDATNGSAPQDVLRDVAMKLADYKLPERLFVVDHIPRNGMGKVIRPQLAEMAAARWV